MASLLRAYPFGVSVPRVDGEKVRRRRRRWRAPDASPSRDSLDTPPYGTAVSRDPAYREDPSPTREIEPVLDGGERPAPPPAAASHVADGSARPTEESAAVPPGAAQGLTGTAREAASDAWARAAAQPAVKRLRRRRKPFWVLIGRTLSKAWQDRILGLSAEAGFWQLLSLPPLLLAVFGTLGYAGDALGADVAVRIETSLVEALRQVLTSNTITESVQPTIEEVLRNGRPDVISVGFLISIWSGSTAMSTYVNTITIAYGERELRGAVRSRLLALRLYFAQVFTGVVLLPALVLGPTLIDRLLRSRLDAWVRHLITYTYWPIVVVLSLSILTSLYHLSVPNRRPWRRAVPGAVLAMLIWTVGCYGLRLYVVAVFDKAVVYGTLAAPVAVLLFFYITAFAVLLGAEFNATLDQARRERQSPPRVS